MFCKRFLFFIAVVFVFGGGFIFPASRTWAVLEPDEVLIIANRLAADSVSLANFYLGKRGIPRQNLLVLKVSAAETCSREDYERKIAVPVRKYLKQQSNEGRRPIRCLLLVYGMPLKVAPGLGCGRCYRSSGRALYSGFSAALAFFQPAARRSFFPGRVFCFIGAFPLLAHGAGG